MDEVRLTELMRTLEENSQNETMPEDQPWVRGGEQQASRIIAVAKWAAIGATGDLYQVAHKLDNITMGLAAVARVYGRQLHILLPWERDDPPATNEWIVPRALSHGADIAALRPFMDIVNITTLRKQIKVDLCFAFIHSAPDFNTYKVDTQYAAQAWLICINDAAWEPNAMRAFTAMRYNLSRGMLLCWKNKEGYLTPQI